MTKQKDFFSKEQIKLARFSKALSHPVRIYIIEILLKESKCYSGDMAEKLPIARSTLSQHLKELKDAGLIFGDIEPPYIKYCIDPENWVIAKKLYDNLFYIK